VPWRPGIFVWDDGSAVEESETSMYTYYTALIEHGNIALAAKKVAIVSRAAAHAGSSVLYGKERRGNTRRGLHPTSLWIVVSYQTTFSPLCPSQELKPKLAVPADQVLGRSPRRAGQPPQISPATLPHRITPELSCFRCW
jgi:hypothetical protein